MKTLIATALLALALSASAGEFPNDYATTSGSVCKPAGKATTNPNGAEFAAKATGGRNEGAGNVFVICPFQVTPTPAEGGALLNLNLSAYTIDGQPRAMTCTAVIGSLNRPIQPTYAAKTATITGPSAEQPTVISWTPEDFNGASQSGGIVGSAWATITCLVPSQTGIALLYATLNPTMR